MRIALKYGLLIAAAVAAWVILKHVVLKAPVPPWLDVVIFNGVELVGIMLAIREQRSRGGELAFGQGVKTGFFTAVVNGVTACLFFAVLYLAIGPELLQEAQEPGFGERSTSAVLAGAFAGLFIGTLVSGLVFSLLLSALMRRSSPPALKTS